MIAHLGMYDLGPVNDALWMLVRRELGHGPDTLTRSDDFWEIWQSPDLLMSQTCGYPFRAHLHGKVQLIGTPDYGLEGCAPGFYRSVFVRRADDARTELGEFAGARFAYNEALSQSGWAAPVLHIQNAGFLPGALLETGGHAKSLVAVSQARADFAALDALTWELIRASDMEIADTVSVLGHTSATPALPFITSHNQDAAALRAALTRAIAAQPDEMRRATRLKGLINIPEADYLAVPSPLAPRELCP